MKLTGFQLALCVSLAAHAVLSAVVVWGGFGWGAAPLPDGRRDSETVLSLVAAPAELVAVLPKETPSAVVPNPIPPPPPLPPPPPEPVSEPRPVVLPEPPPPPVAEVAIEPEPEPEPLPPSDFVTPSAGAPISPPMTPPAPAPASVSTGIHATQKPVSGAVRLEATGNNAISGLAPIGVRAQPNYRKNPEPVYPLAARRRRQEGLVLLSVTVSAEGRATQVMVKQSSGVAVLDEAALRAVQDWEFEPARMGRKALSSEIEVPVRFQLHP